MTCTVDRIQSEAITSLIARINLQENQRRKPLTKVSMARCGHKFTILGLAKVYELICGPGDPDACSSKRSCISWTKENDNSMSLAPINNAH